MAVKDLDELHYSSYVGLNGQLTRWRYELLSIFFRPERCLELGSADGQGTEYLLRRFGLVTAVDGSTEAVEELRRRYASADTLEIVHSRFENLDLQRQYDTVVVAHTLDHAQDPDGLLATARKYLKEDGVLLVDVPNGMSLHRQLGVEMGVLTKVTDITEPEALHGHLRVYTPETIRAAVAAAGFRIRTFGGLFLKLLPNAQTEAAFTPEQLEGLLTLGMRYAEISAEIYLVATKA
jgi:2-polyprenyl-3-methyl-5-hydroxy-6-metoxy-1,4-benzoquinol methylase